MSSTGRSKRDKSLIDYYVTPIPVIGDFLTAFHNKHKIIVNGEKSDFGKKPIKILDCCAGGRIGQETSSYPEALKRQQLFDIEKIQTLDIRSDSPAAITGISYLDWKVDDDYDMIITNPPFVLAKEIILKALQDVKPGGLVIMLLRLNFYGSAERRPFFNDNMPIASFVHSKRISFCNGPSDSIEYQHAIWQKGVVNEDKFTKLFLI